MIDPVSVISDAPADAIPKSVTFAASSGPTMTLCGLKSRCTTPRLWANDAAWRIWMVRSIARRWSSGASSPISCLSVRPLTRSIAMYQVPSKLPRS